MSVNLGHQSITNFKINRLIIQETGTYNQQFLRPWQTHVDFEIQNAFTSIAQQYGTNIPLMVFNDVSGGFLQKQANPDSPIGIPNGWGERRIRFFLETQHEYITGGKIKSYYLGYTDHTGVSVSGAIDPRMFFFVNSFVRTRTHLINTPSGMAEKEEVFESKQMLHGGNRAYDPNQVLSMRPQELYRFFNPDSELMNLGAQTMGTVISDTRLQIPSIGTLTDRSNNTPTSYTSNVFGGILSNSSNHELGLPKSECVNAYISTMENGSDNVAKDPLFKSISNAHGSLASGRFTYSDLMKIEPNVYNVTNYIVVPAAEKGKLHQAGMTSEWHGSDICTKSAASLGHSVPALMTENMITRIVLTSTNADFGGKINTQIIHANSFSNGDMRRYYDRFRASFEALLNTEITYRNALTYMLEMNVDLLGETWIKISIDGSPVYDYVTPSFSDGLFSPLISSNRENVLNVASDFNCVYETALDSLYTGRPENIFAPIVSSI